MGLNSTSICQDTRIPGYKDTRIPEYQDTRILGYIPGYKDTRKQQVYSKIDY